MLKQYAIKFLNYFHILKLKELKINRALTGFFVETHHLTISLLTMLDLNSACKFSLAGSFVLFDLWVAQL